MKEIKQEWCENWIKALFARIHRLVPNGGIAYSHFWELAAKSGLYTPGTYNTPMSRALEELTAVESIHDENGEFLYHAFKLKNNAE